MKLVYENKLSCENDVKDFVLEGSAEIYFENGKMRMKNALSADLGQKSNFVYWCNEDFPSDVQIEWDFRPIEEPGLAILFFSAKGVNGEDLFDPSLQERDGQYNLYHSGDINAYHVSYFRRKWDEERGFHTCNLRKSKGFHLVVQGADPIPNCEDAFESYHIKLVKKDGKIDLSSVGISPEEFAQYHRICIVACGSAYHVGIAAKYVMEDLTGLMVDVDFASEFRYRNPKLSKDTLVVIISQSGETADSLAALRLTKEMGVKTLAIVNVVGSSIAREADHVMYTLAGPEIAVATTKAYSTQLICMYILSMYAAQVRGEIEESTLGNMLKEIVLLPEKVASILADKERIQWFANKFASAHDVFFIGRGLDYAICQEGSLKMKEVSYVHSEAYAAGELKHGTISLIEDGTLVIGVLTQSHLCEKTLSNMQEVKSRGAYLMGVAENGSYYLEDMVDFVVYVPKTDPHFTTTLAIIPLQLMGYYVSVARGLDVDKPRNLAKSVTVE